MKNTRTSGQLCVLMCALGSGVGLGAGCGKEITGPEPALSGLDPSLACGDQLVTEVAISGEGLSPLAIDAATDEPHLAIPDVTLRRMEDLAGNPASDVYTLPNDPFDPGSARVRWTSETSMAFDVYPELGLESGLYEITVTNRNGKSATFQAAITVVPKPVLDAVEPDMVCLEQGMRPITLRGEGFLSVGTELPTVTVGTLEIAVDSLEDCVALPGPTEAETCLTARITLAEDALEPGAPNVTITNPQPAACQSEEDVTMAIVPRPTLAAVVPDLFCNAQGERTLSILGTGFVTLTDGDGNTTYPEVRIGTETLTASGASSCEDVAGTLLDAESCGELTLVVRDTLSLLGEQDVVVTNPDPAGCYTEESITVAIVPPPTLSAVVPDLVCNAESDRTLTLSGTGFIVITEGGTDTLPEVTIDGETYDADTGDGCASIAGTLLHAASCDTLTVTVPEDDIGPGAHSVSVTNPTPAGCTSTEAITLAIVPEPTLVSVSDDLFCPERVGGHALTLTGTGFVSYDDGGGAVLPTVWFGDTGTGIAIAADSVGGTCAAIAGTAPSTTAQSCTELTVTVPAATVAAGEYTLHVENPPPAGCDSNETGVTVFVAGAPEIATVSETLLCETAQPPTIRLTGTGFLRNDSDATVPTVVVSSGILQQSMTGVVLGGACDPLTGTAISGALCDQLTFDVPTSGALADANGFLVGSYAIDVTNPPPADCTTSAPGTFDVTGAPVITAFDPPKVCVNGDTFTVEGSGFAAGSQIVLTDPDTMNTYEPPTVLTEPIGPPQVLTGTIDPLTIAIPADDNYEITVSNGGTCVSDPVGPFRVVAAPVVFFVDPPRIYNQIDMRITVWVSGIDGASPAVGIRRTGTADPLTMLGNPTYNGTNRIFADLTTDLGVGPGDYDVVVLDDPCETGLQNILHVTDAADLYVAGIEPSFAEEMTRIGVTMKSQDPPPGPFTAAFERTPRAYLNPVGGGVATEIRAVAFYDTETLDGVVPALPDGQYELIVVNPGVDGEVGVGPTFTVLDVADPPPVIDALVPGLVVAGPASAVGIVGANFPTDPLDLSVTAECVDPATPGAPTPLTAAVNPGTLTSTNIDTTWDTSGMAGWTCVVRVSNLANGSYVDFSALSVANGSGNINQFVASRDMVVPRRALAAAAIRMNQRSRYLFAIGGDAGDGLTRRKSVEHVPIDPFGDLSANWELQRNELPVARAFMAATVVNRHLYIAGGRVGDAIDAGAVDDEVWRAYLLDPFEAPEIDDLDLLPGEATGLASGIWYYRVAAIMDDGGVLAADPNNPGGEALASEPFVIQLPDLAGLQLRLYWDHIPGAVKYRIYRTKAPGGISGDEVILAEIDPVGGAATPDARQSFLDTGLDNTGVDELDPTNLPMPLGSLGVWHQVGTLATEREGAGLVAAPDPVEPTAHYLYVVGGRDADGATQAALDDIEWVEITAASSSNQTLDAGGFQVDAAALPAGRWQIGAVYVDARRASAVSDPDVWVYVLPGIDEGGGKVGDVDALAVDVADGTPDGDGIDGDGSLGIPQSMPNPGPTFAGYGYVAGNNYLHLLGGQTGGPHAGGNETLIDGSPGLDGWSAGTSLGSIGRYLHGAAFESSFIYLLGGETTVPEAASRSTARTNF